ncbi:LysR family transcriptional regulator [Chitinophaga sp.]|uniref:LysR family transcriptional regulator n=1 Tax=Chitinophaga sp. TaxID=1869181 RepID=UPI0031DB4F3C
MVNLEWYRTFKAVYQTGSLTAASKALFISQPNVSQHLSALEAHVGKQLFERKPRLVATDYGKLFYTQVVAALEKLEEVEADFKAICCLSQLPIIRVGAVKEFFHAVSSEKVARIPASLMISFGLTGELTARLSRGEIDFVIATQKTEKKNMIYEPIVKEEFAIVGSPDLETTAFNKFVKSKDWQQAEDWLLKQIWFAYSSDLAIIRRFWLKNFKKRPAIKPRFTIPDMQVILKAISAGGGLTITADYLAKELLLEKKLKLVWKGHTISDNILYLVYDKTKVTTEKIKLARMLLTSANL